MSDKIKILAYCDFASATGFSQVAQNILTELYNTGDFEIEILAINYHGNPTPLQSMFKLWPVLMNSGGKDPYGREWAKSMFKEMKYDILFTIQDSFILEFIGSVIDDIRNRNPKMGWINYFPVDGIPKKEWLQVMAKADYPVTYTEWGKNLCCEVYPPIKDKLRAIPHGINVRDFYPIRKTQNISFREQYFGPHASKFIVTNVNRNQQRKDIPRGMAAFKKFNELHPDSLLYCHMATNDHGWDLFQVSKSLGLTINKNIAFPQNFNPNQGYPIDIVNNIYNASDVIISSTLGEGALLEDTLVYSDRGLIPIKDISVDDSVFTHKNRFSKVGKKLKVTPKEDVYKLRLYKFNEPLYLTKEHPVLTDRGFVKIEQLNVTDKVLFVKHLYEDTVSDILSIEKINMQGSVFYDLQVPGDNSYTTSVCTVHNCGLAQIEAMATCTPIISPDNTASTEILGKDRGILVRSGWNDEAWTVLPHDNEILRPLMHIGDMVDALVKLKGDESERKRLALNGYKWVTSTLQWDKHIVPVWEKIFRDAYAASESKVVSGQGLSLVEV